MTCIRRTLRRILLLAALAAVPPPQAARADGLQDKIAVCTTCHGEQGVPIDASIPVIWGQTEGYLYFQLRDLKNGARKSEVMSPIAATLEKQDMKDLAAYFAGKPWPSLGQKRAPHDVAQHAEAVNGSAGCQGCHLDAWQGGGTTPRVAGQSLTYLRNSMAAFRDGARANNPWMSALLKTYSDADIEALAQYIAGY